MNISGQQLLCICAFLSLSFAALAHTGATGIVKERMDFFSRSKDNLKAIKLHLRKGDLDSVISRAEDIRDWAIKMPKYFPEGSNGKPSEASPKIWTDFDNFRKLSYANRDAATKLISAATSGDLNATITAFKVTAETCKSCHKMYRLD